MRKILNGMAAVVLGAGLAMGPARADSTFTSQFQGGPGVNITYSTGSGTASEGTAAGPFTLTPTSPSGSALDAFCVSPDVQVGWGPDVIHTSSVLSLNTVGQSFFTHSNYADVGNRLAFLLVSHGGGDVNTDAALALSIWYTMDKNFSYTGADSTVAGLYTSYISFAGYDSSTLYGGSDAKLFVVDPAGSYQNLIGITSQSFVPEPSSVISAAVGMSASGLFVLRRARRRKGAARSAA
ncbi:hypothetical protein [Paludisphaera mucosa]|uniref:PEP-CTERM protein-sorting domain-containing protein n=1 Tax=Paludisphaera mucosa TaxID=3030827 RepID=A0ABT6F4M7_9BACT|nr:hypothetical protein [Paludisphaera mucosa]MDG3002543.1 hypothetical protein [Paludisphaera mucosa]